MKTPSSLIADSSPALDLQSVTAHSCCFPLFSLSFLSLYLVVDLGPSRLRKKKTEVRDKKDLILLITVVLWLWQRHNCWFFLLWALWWIPWRFSGGDLLSKVLLGQAWPPPTGHRAVHPSVESHHHSSQSSCDGSRLRGAQASPGWPSRETFI